MTSPRSSRAFPSRPFPFPFPLSPAAIALVLATTFPGITFGQASNRSATKFYPDFSDTADALLRSASSHARDRQWSEAIDIYQKVIQNYGEKVARLPKEDAGQGAGGDSVLYVDLREFCQRRLAALPAEARAVYRTRADGQAERWFRRGEADRDVAALRRVIDQAFCSSWGDDAADLLGDLSFQEGRFEEALAFYRLLVPDPPAGATTLTYPDPEVDLARVAAKKLLCRAALGENPPTPADVDAFARDFPDAKGPLAGRDGPYRESLAEALKLDHLDPPAQPDGRWPTFAGSPARSRVVPGPVDVGSLQWRVELPAVQPGRSSGYRRGMPVTSTPPRPEKLLAYHPIVVGDQVIVCDEGQVLAYNLNDRAEATPAGTPGAVRPAWRHEAENHGGISAARNVLGIPRYTLTAFGDRIYARMGTTSGPYFGRMGQPSQSSLVALDRGTEGKSLWKVGPADVIPARRPGEAAGRNLGFEGSPVADARGVYVALTDRREQTSTYVACLDPDTGAARWVRYLGAASADGELGFGGGMGMGMGAPQGNDFGHRLLSLRGPTLYFQTNLGAVAAIDAESGSIRWVATYPRIDRGAGAASDRDLNPAVVHDGLVIVAPDDAPAIYAFEATSGRAVWRTDPLPEEVKLTHLLGVAKGRLVATGDRVLLFDVRNGKLLHSWPDNGHGTEGYGRGLLAGDKIFWPTRTEIHVLDQSTGLRTDPPIKLQESFQESGGNLAVGDGYLVVAQGDRLVVFCQNRRLIQRYREEIAKTPGQAAPYYRLARAAEATGEDELALQSLDEALGKAKPSETVDGLALASAARDQQFRLLMRLGERARVAGEAGASELRFRSAAGAARTDRDLLKARLSEADAQLARGEPGLSVSTLQALLAEDRFRSLNVAADGGRRSVRSDLYVANLLATIVKANGRKVYAEFDRQADALLGRGLKAGDPRQIEEVARSFPVAGAVPVSLLALGEHYDGRERWMDSARVYRRLAGLPAADEQRARAALGLARAYEAQKLWGPARDAYTQAARRFPGAAVGPGGAPLGPLVARRLAEPPFDRLSSDRAEPSLPAPLSRRWQVRVEGTVRPVVADGLPPSHESGRVFLARGNELLPVDTATGASRWSADLGGPPAWVGYLDDRVLAATETRLVALGLESGEVLWQFNAAAGGRGPNRRGVNPFAREPEAKPGAEPTGKLSGFRVVGNRAYCLRGDRELIAFDGDGGLVDWSYTPTTGSINPHLLVGPNRAVVQLRDPSVVLVLDSATGQRLSEFPQPGAGAWSRPPLPLDEDHVVVVPDARSVALFDLSKGVNSWVFRESEELPKNGPPRPFGDAERLLVVQDGLELIRLDAATGAKKWSRPLGTEDLKDRPAAFAIDQDQVYWANKQSLNGARLSDGSVVWSRHLAGPESGWSVELTDRCVVAYPGQPRGGDNEPAGLPVAFRRRDDGRLVQRMLFPVNAAEVAVRLFPRGALVATPAGLWSLGERTPPGAGVDAR